MKKVLEAKWNMILKKILAHIFIISIFLTTIGCSRSKKTNFLISNNNTSVELVEVVSTGEIGYEDFAFFGGTALIDSTGDYLKYIKDELFPFNYKGKYGYVDAKGNIIIDSIYKSVGYFSDNKAIVETMDGKYNIINQKGECIASFLKDDIHIDCVESVIKNDKIIDCNFSYDINFLGVLTIDKLEINGIKSTSRTEKISGKTRWSNLYLKAINTLEFSGALIHSDEYFGNSYTALYDENGSLICKYDNLAYDAFKSCGDIMYDQKIFVSNGYVNVTDENGMWGLKDLKTDRIVVDYSYDYVGMYSNDVIPVCKYGKWGSIDIKGNEIIPCSMKYIGAFNNDRAFAITGDQKKCIIDKKGSVITDISFISGFSSTSTPRYVYPFSKKTGISIYKDSDNSYLFTDQGKYLGKFDNISYLSDHYVFGDGKMYEIVLK